MSSLDKFQMLTLAFGAGVIISVFVEYNESDLNENLMSGIKAFERGLPFLLSAYALIVSAAPNAEARMYKNLILLTVGISWFFVIYKKLAFSASENTDGKWEQVNANVTYNLALGGLFALPVALCGFRV